MLDYFPGYRDIKYFDPARKREILVAIWYPTFTPSCSVTYLTHFKSWATPEGELATNESPVIFISHGSRGHRYNQYYLAEYLARAGYIVISIEHAEDTAFNDLLSNSSVIHEHRILDFCYVLEKISEDKIFINSKSSIGLVGHSFGGLTAFLLAGGRSYFLNKKNHEKITNKIIEKIKSIVLLAPALSDAIDLNYPVKKSALLITAENDELIKRSDLIYKNVLRNVKHVDLPYAGHYVFLMTCPKKIRDQCPSICIDRGISRKRIHPFLKKLILDFLDDQFRKNRCK